jgi:glutamate dehydrogenase/leucine dehydrogenase
MTFMMCAMDMMRRVGRYEKPGVVTGRMLRMMAG